MSLKAFEKTRISDFAQMQPIHTDMSEVPQNNDGQNVTPLPPLTPPAQPAASVACPPPPPPVTSQAAFPSPQQATQVVIPKVLGPEEEQPDTPGGACFNMGCQCVLWALLIAVLGATVGAFPWSFGQTFLIMFGSFLALGLYFLPAVFAFSFKHPYRWPILAVNLFFGCTAIGWVLAFIWCFVGRPQTGK